MGKTLRVLNVEDSERDVALLTHHLTAAYYTLVSERVETADDMRAALESSEWDVILCDYSMPKFDALSALNVLRKSGLDIPFIIISGTVGEEVAVEAMLTGAHDYLPKDNLTRLVPAIERELNEAKNRRSQREAEAALKSSEAELRTLFQVMNDVILVLDSEGRHLKVAPTRPTQSYKRSVHRLGKTVHEILPAEVADLILRNIKQCLDEARTLHVEYALVIDGQDVWFDATVTPMTEDSVMWVAREVTERKRTEDERRIIFDVIQGAVATPDLDEFLKLVHRSISELVYAENCFVMLHDPVSDMIHYEFWIDKHDLVPPPGPAGRGFGAYILRTGKPLLITEESKKRLIDAGEADQIGSSSPSWLGVALRTPERTIGVLAIQHYKLRNAYDQRDLEFLASVGDQIALAIERKRAEGLLRESEESYRTLFESAPDGILVTVPGESIVDANTSLCRMLGYSRDELLKLKGTDIIAPSEIPQIETAVETIKANNLLQREWLLRRKDGSIFAADVFSSLMPDGHALSMMRDITEKKRAESLLRESEESYRDLVENALDIIYTHDLEGNYTSANRAAETITGYTTARSHWH